MPKISAPTVAEHREAQHAALLQAAEEILLTGGVEAVSPAAVTKQAGLARSTFYEYFPSKDDLLVALAREAFEQWADELERDVSAVASGPDRLRAYVRTTLRLTADGRHGLATTLRGVRLSPKSHDDIAALHAALDDPLQDLLADLVDDPRAHAPLVHGLLGAAMAQVTAGADPVATADRAAHLLLSGFGNRDSDTLSLN
ncbi:TetR/AcrR family transcriptional regulator [Microbacterium gorillae]|uniref:TetR/AcrR family transcriptional regulator n=1 Tax=Microbacterium gorillae TaxID=1231063 RepID=UPI0006949063|nr:TetR/AcrR family transcriptional regulator [Microbacterium gorillae]